MSLNKITLSGNLGADAELRYTKSGNPVVSFSLAVNERTPNGDGTWGEYTNWPDCVMFGKRAEALAPWLRKGTKISLIGRIHTRSYQKDGQSIKRWEVRVDDVELMQYKRDAQSPAPANAAAPCLAMKDVRHQEEGQRDKAARFYRACARSRGICKRFFVSGRFNRCASVSQ